MACAIYTIGTRPGALPVPAIEVLEHIRRQLALCVDSQDDIELPPILLLGGPGIGKTHFARRAVQAAFGNAKVAGRDELSPEDVDILRGGKGQRIGF